MSKEIFLIADLHFGHKGMVTFTREDGSRMRPFATIEAHDEALVQHWNENVRPTDKVYVLGDVALSRNGLMTISRCNGDKVLIRGNHDMEDLKYYAKVFRDVRGCWQLEGCLLSHIPIHPQSLSRWRANVHGHLHSKRVMKWAEGPNVSQFLEVPDERYICVSAEQTDYKPINWCAVRARVPGRVPGEQL